MKRLIGIFAIALLCSWHTARAAVVMDFTFTNDFNEDLVNGQVRFRLTFDSILDGNPDGNLGSYSAKVTLLSGGSSIDSQQPVTVEVANDIGGIDTFSMSSANFTSILDVDGVLTNTAAFKLTSVNQSMFASDALPLTSDFVSKVEFSDVTLGLGDQTKTFPTPQPELTITTINTPVPEPSAYVLLIAGLAGMLGAVRMRRAPLFKP
jgi:hypothetical protein